MRVTSEEAGRGVRGRPEGNRWGQSLSPWDLWETRPRQPVKSAAAAGPLSAGWPAGATIISDAIMSRAADGDAARESARRRPPAATRFGRHTTVHLILLMKICKK